MRIRARVPRVIASTVEAGPSDFGPALDGRLDPVANTWKLPPHGVALVGRPAVWYSLDVSTPHIGLGPVAIPALRLRVEEDFGGHLFLVVADETGEQAYVLEAGPSNPNGTGALVPFRYSELDFVKRGEVDFDPVAIAPPHGLSAEFFARSLVEAQRAYDGDQRYLAVEIPFLRVGRDSNSYACGLLLACGVDPRAIPKPSKTLRREWAGYPGVEDPVHRANFGAYLGAPTDLGDGNLAAAYHAAGGDVLYVAVGGRPHGTARLPDGSEVTLDALGRFIIEPQEARRRGLPAAHTEPPAQLRERRHFPADPAPAGKEITLVVDGRSEPLRPGDEHRGTIVARNDALALATLREGEREIVLPLVELGVELRDPARVDRLLSVGNELTVGLYEDRRPKLVAHGEAAAADAAAPQRVHLDAPAATSRRPDVVRGFAAGATGGLASAAFKILSERLVTPQREGEPQAALAANWIASALLGGAYGGLVELLPALAAGRGAVFGLVVWAQHAALRAGQPGAPRAALEHANEAAGHVLWGVVLESARSVLRSSP
ncbi:MAG: hypothetical protein WAJ85_03735 [Candidatus Baltobacteraceae bacterium]